MVYRDEVHMVHMIGGSGRNGQGRQLWQGQSGWLQLEARSAPEQL